MRSLLLSLTAAALIAPLASAPASAQGYGYRNGYGYSHGYGYGHRNDVRREQRECRRELRRADSRREYYRELRECRREIAEARRDRWRDRDYRRNYWGRDRW